MQDTITHPRVGQRLGICGFRNGFSYATVTGLSGYSMAVELPDGEATVLDTRCHTFVTEDRTETAWCPECRRTREVEDRSDESHMTRAGEVGYRVTRLDCGHTDQGPSTVVAPAPGAPYAGPGVAVAASHHPRDMRAARARQDALDHPYGPEHDQ